MANKRKREELTNNELNANEDEEIFNELSAGAEDVNDNPDTYNRGGTGSGVAPVSDITGHARGDTRPVIGRVPLGAEEPFLDHSPHSEDEAGEDERWE